MRSAALVASCYWHAPIEAYNFSNIDVCPSVHLELLTHLPGSSHLNEKLVDISLKSHPQMISKSIGKAN
jgi:hypothetical protein